MENVNKFFQQIISNLLDQSGYQSIENIFVIKSLGFPEIDKHVYAINKFWFENVKHEDINIYAKQIARECAFLYDSLIGKLLSFSPSNQTLLESFKNGEKVIIENMDKNKIDITNLLKDVEYFTQRISMIFDCANIDLNKIYGTFQIYLKHKNILNFTPYDREKIN